MRFTREKIRRARLLSKCGRIYSEVFLKKPDNKLQFRNDYISVSHFLVNCAFERFQAPSKKYREVAIKALEETFRGSLETITQAKIKNCWANCLKQYSRRELNATHFPLNCESDTKSPNRSLLRVMLDNDITNLAKWSKKRLKQNRLREAHRTIKGIRGIGKKIASFYLRDIAFLIGFDEYSIGDSNLLQPIDLWVNRALEIILDEELGSPETNYYPKTNTIVNLCEQADCSAMMFNMGAWVVGSQVASSEYEFRDILKDKKHRILKQKERQISEEVDRLLLDVDEKKKIALTLSGLLDDLSFG
ncbi:MAG: hypothetical protein ACXACG_02645 [Candidatus Thorarchaeota archaeon]|jgi:thermostable 8-oxoguanine DNA glycosylase